MTQIVMPMHTNGVAGVMFGGIMMQWIDVCAGVAAMRHAGGAVLTASIDRLDFLSPVQVGEIVVLQAMVNSVSRTSMEVGCRVETEHMQTRARRYVTKAYLTFVAIDDHGRPRAISDLTLETEDDHRRHAAAQTRRTERLRASGRAKHEDGGAS
ncbi:MAG TPA: acyl-CoA thioesterase [Kofleriaceae bacterium]